MSSDNSKDTATFRDELPEGCPPENADKIIRETICYRIVHNDPPNEEDFRSQRALHPNQDFGLSECRVRGLSIFMQQADAERVAQGSRNLRGAKLGKLTLERGAGCIKKTGSRSHHTWWPYKEFDILANCGVME